jgi:hypothetical protein
MTIIDWIVLVSICSFIYGGLLAIALVKWWWTLRNEFRR